MAKLYFKYGTMSSGKSLRLLSTAHQFKINNIPYQLMKPNIDTREYGIIKSRIGVEEICTLLDSTESVVTKIDRNVKWVLIDEAQFLMKYQVDELCYIVDNYDINVICYGLRTDYMTNLFEGSKRLFELADELEELPSYCECGNKTMVNARIDKNGEIDICDGEQILIGGDETYKSFCRKCFMKQLLDKTEDVTQS